MDQETAKKHSFKKTPALYRHGLEKKIHGIDTADGTILLVNYCVFRFLTNKKYHMKKKETIAPVKTKTTVNNTAAKNAIKNTQEETKKNISKKTVPVVKDIDESNPERK
jgi:hypothetical protein